MQLKQMETIPDKPHQQWFQVDPATVPQRMLNAGKLSSFRRGEGRPTILNDYIFPIAANDYRAWLQNNTTPPTPPRIESAPGTWLMGRCFTKARIRDPLAPADERELARLGDGEYTVRRTHNDTHDQLHIRINDNTEVYIFDPPHRWRIDGNGLTVNTLTEATHGVTIINNEMTIHDAIRARNALVTRANERPATDIRDDTTEGSGPEVIT